MMLNTIFLISFSVCLLVLFQKKLRTNDTWRATVTPLASIIGSGFLIAAPVFRFSLGQYALLGMLLLTAFAYSIGSALRFLLAQKKSPINPKSIVLSELLLVLAYIISISFYIKLLALFSLKIFNLDSHIFANLLGSVLILGIGIFGYRYKLSFLEKLETVSVSIKLAIIFAFLVCLFVYNGNIYFLDGYPKAQPIELSSRSLQILMGALVLTQGFETSLFLKDNYSAPVLIKSMRGAQIISTIIYLLFVALLMPNFALITSATETAIIDMSSVIATILPISLIIAAQFSQFSAAVADTIGGGGLIHKVSKGRFSSNYGYLLISLVALSFIWFTNIFEIISFASKAFAAFYLTQVLNAVFIAINRKYYGRAIFYSSICVGLVACIIFGSSIE